VGVELRHNVGDLYHQQSKKEKDDIPGTAYIAGKEVSCDDHGQLFRLRWVPIWIIS